MHIVLKFSRFISNNTLTSPFAKLKNKMQIGTICVAEKVTFGNCHSVGVNLGKILTTRMETGHIFKEMGNFLLVKIQTYLNLSLLRLLEK